MKSLLLAITTLSLGASSLCSADLIICGNDQTVGYATNEMVFQEKQAPGSLSVIDITSSPPSAYTIEGVPVSVIGPPTTIGKVPHRPLALSANSMRPEKVDGQWKHVPDNKVTLVRLGEKSGSVVGQAEVGLQPSGLSISPDGTRAYVANRAEGSISVLTINDDGLREIQRVKVCEPADSISHLELSPDGKCALALLNKASAVLVLKLNAEGLPEVTQRLAAGDGPYSARFTPDGQRAFVANIVSDSIAELDLSGEQAKALRQIPVGHIPEGLNISPDGKWLAVTCMEGRNLIDKKDLNYGHPAVIYLLHEKDGSFEITQKITAEGGPQFAVFSADNQYLIASNTGSKKLNFYRQENGQFEKIDFQLSLDGEPVAVAR